MLTLFDLNSHERQMQENTFQKEKYPFKVVNEIVRLKLIKDSLTEQVYFSKINRQGWFEHRSVIYTTRYNI